MQTFTPVPTPPVERHDDEQPLDAVPRAPRWQARTLVAGGLLFALGNALHPLVHDDAAYRYPTWEAAHLIILASLPLLVLGLPSLHPRLAGRVPGPLAVVPLVATIGGLVGIGPSAVLETFVAPTMGFDAFTELESGGLALVNTVFGIAYLGGSLGLGWAIHRARLAPRGCGMAIVVSTVALFGTMASTGPVSGLVIIICTAVYGLALAALGARS